jgi:hypothetical protein
MGQEEGRGRDVGVQVVSMSEGFSVIVCGGGLGLKRVGDGTIVMSNEWTVVTAESIDARSGLGGRAGHRCGMG